MTKLFPQHILAIWLGLSSYHLREPQQISLTENFSTTRDQIIKSALSDKSHQFLKLLP